MTRKSLLVLAVAAGLLVACKEDDPAGDALKAVGSQIASATDETSTPTALDELPVTDTDTDIDETSEPVSIN